jgi:hypothetical protein
MRPGQIGHFLIIAVAAIALSGCALIPGAPSLYGALNKGKNVDQSKATDGSAVPSNSPANPPTSPSANGGNDQSKSDDTGMTFNCPSLCFVDGHPGCCTGSE